MKHLIKAITEMATQQPAEEIQEDAMKNVKKEAS